MKEEKMGKNKPYRVSKLFAEHSPMKNIEKIRFYLQKYKKDKSSVGFTITTSLKSMGLIPRSNGKYMLGKKYQQLRS